MLNFRTTEDDYQTVKNFARMQGKSVSAFVMDAIWEKIEDWEDMQAVREYERGKTAGKENKLYSLDDVIREHGIDI